MIPLGGLVFDYIKYLKEKLETASDDDKKVIKKELKYLKKLFEDNELPSYIQTKTYSEQLKEMFKGLE